MPQFQHLQNASEQRALQDEVFQAALTAITSGKLAALCADGRALHGQRKNLTLFKEQVYQIYDFLQSTSDPKNG